MTPAAISVVIRTFNSGKTLGQVIKSLDLAAEDQIVVADSGSQDGTLQIASELGAEIEQVPPPFNYSKSLNYGFRAARNPWVLVLSSHSLPTVADFLARYRKEAATLPEDVVVIYGASTISGLSDPLLDAKKTVFYSEKDYQPVLRVCGNGNTLYRRSAWAELPFDESIRTSEDKIWIMEMIRRHYRFVYLPTVPTLNRNQASLAYMFRKGFSDARTLRNEEHRPMRPIHLAGALKNIGKQRLRGEIDHGNWLRYSAHTFGQFFASYFPEDNLPKR